MAYMVDHQQQSSFKHFCKICKKGFGCGRALGGHMRAHGIGDESGHVDDDDPASDWEDKLGGNNVPPSNKRMYALRTNPNRLKSCRVCENCGKEFLSWKSFLEHGKCSEEDAESLVSSPGSDGYDDQNGGGGGGDGDGDGDGDGGRRGCGWLKRKRSFRAKVGNYNSNCPSSEEEDLANCLMMLSNATTNVDPLLAEPEESCASASREDQERRNPINFGFAAPPISYRAPPTTDHKAKGVASSKGGGMFECKACKKVFNSHQALGGHRASHKKVKGCFAARLDHNLDDSLADDQDVITHDEYFQLPPSKSTSTLHLEPPPHSLMAGKRKSKVHECSICHRIFSSGQALGGHKRCHWLTSSAQPDTSSSQLAKFHHHHQFHDIEQVSASVVVHHTHSTRPKFIDKSEPLDLNLPATVAPPPSGDHHVRRDPRNPLSFEVSTEIFLQQPWNDVDAKEEDTNKNKYKNNVVGGDDHNIKNDKNTLKDDGGSNNNNNNMQEVEEDEADSKVKLAKLSDLKDMNMSGGSSPWLQVGIGSSTDLGAADL